MTRRHHLKQPGGFSPSKPSWAACVSPAVVGLALLLPPQVLSQVRQTLEATPATTIGPQTDGSTILPSGWKLTPAGKQIALSTLPMSLAVSPDEKYAVVLNGGFLPPTLSVIDLSSLTESARTPLKDGWHGLVFNKAGDKLYVGGGSAVSVFEFGFQEGKLTPQREFAVRPPERRRASDHVGDVVLGPEGRFLYSADVFRNTITVMNAATGFVVKEFLTGFRPYRMLIGPVGETLLVSHWGESSVGVYSLSDGRLIEKIPTGAHPTDMLLRPGRLEADESAPPIVARLFVACANTNSVSVLGVTEGGRYRQIETLSVSPTPVAPAGSMPTAVALSPDGNRLYVVSSGNNAIVVADVSQESSSVVGAIPTGWYPTDAVATADGRLLYLSGKGAGSHPAPDGPDPTQRGKKVQYVAAVQTGSLGVVPELGLQELDAHTLQVISNTPYDDRLLSDAGVPPGNPIPTRPRAESPIQHVIYVIKENRTYDQIFGGIMEENGDPQRTVFGESITPNHHRLAREFVLFDNFYVNGDVSADGQNWSVAGIANDFVEKLWPSYYGRRRKVYDFEGGESAAIPPAAYLWSNALAARLAVRSYGLWAEDSARGVKVKDPGLAPFTDRQFVPFRFDYADGRRVDEFLRELAEFETAGELPRLMLVRLPGDHTAGRAPGLPTAESMMAEHDYALGRLVEAVSRSRFWPRTAIFVLEDDSQDGADHVDSHRSPLLIASSYARRGAVDHTHYSTTSVLRTIELILGLRPMTQFDAAATPLWRAFQPDADPRPFEASKPKIPLDQRNPEGSGGQPRRVRNSSPRLVKSLDSS